MKPHKTLFIKTPEEMYKGIRKRKWENLQDVKFSQTRCQNPSMSKITRLPAVFQSYFSIDRLQ
jgi:hypothetical protein